VPPAARREATRRGPRRGPLRWSAFGAAAIGAAALFFGGVLAGEGSQARPPVAVEAAALTREGLRHLAAVRETGDVSLYVRAERALEDALRLEPNNLYAMTGLAALAASRHRFDEARRIAQRAIALSPETAAPYGILGDALLETGRYREAFAAFDRMVALKPGATGYARISYARELLGDTEGAIEAMKLAVAAAAPTAEPAAWSLVQLGNLELGSG
jgi:tetratricopeptide (TPR) repeat protein